MSESQTALGLVRSLRALLASEGWTGAMAPHLTRERDRLMARILEEDTLAPGERDSLRLQYKVFRDLLRWPALTLHAQLQLLEDSPAPPDEPPQRTIQTLEDGLDL